MLSLTQVISIIVNSIGALCTSAGQCILNWLLIFCGVYDQSSGNVATASVSSHMQE